MNNKRNNVFIIAEAGSVHDGSLGNAIKLIELAGSCGADAIKFQTHIAEAETIKDAPMPKFFSGEPRYSYFERTGFDKDQWIELYDNCKKNDIEFMSSPFSLEAVGLLEEINMKRYKIPSGEVTNIPLLECVAEKKKPIIISSGMSTWKELDKAINTIEKVNTNNTTVLQCTTEYPCDYKNVGLNVMLEMKDRYSLPVGLSDHTITNYASFAAVTLGAVVIEKHFTFSREMYGSDAKHSLTPKEFEDLTSGLRAIETIKENDVNKDKYAEMINDMKIVFQKSIVSKVFIKKDTVIKENMISFKKPGTGIEPHNIDKVIGKKTKTDIPENTIITLKQLL